MFDIKAGGFVNQFIKPIITFGTIIACFGCGDESERSDTNDRVSTKIRSADKESDSTSFSRFTYVQTPTKCPGNAYEQIVFGISPTNKSLNLSKFTVSFVNAITNPQTAPNYLSHAANPETKERMYTYPADSSPIIPRENRYEIEEEIWRMNTSKIRRCWNNETICTYSPFLNALPLDISTDISKGTSLYVSTSEDHRDIIEMRILDKGAVFADVAGKPLVYSRCILRTEMKNESRFQFWKQRDETVFLKNLENQSHDFATSRSGRLKEYRDVFTDVEQSEYEFYEFYTNVTSFHPFQVVEFIDLATISESLHERCNKLPHTNLRIVYDSSGKIKIRSSIFSDYNLKYTPDESKFVTATRFPPNFDSRRQQPISHLETGPYGTSVTIPLDFSEHSQQLIRLRLDSEDRNNWQDVSLNSVYFNCFSDWERSAWSE